MKNLIDMKIKTFFLILGFLVLYSFSVAQDFTASGVRVDSTNFDPQSLDTHQPFGFDLTMGTLIGRFGSGRTTSSFVAPKINYHLNSKWKLSGGILFFNNITPLAINATKDAILPYAATPRNLYIFSESVYQVSEKISIHGSVFKNLSAPENKFMVNPMMNFSNNFANLGFNFQLNENISFGAQFSISEGYYPYHNTFYSPSFGTFNPYRNTIPFNF